MSIRRLTVWTLLIALCAAPAFAEEPNGEDSAAARLFREGWWLETGAGALDRAKAKYEAAVAAEGSSSIRARAQYRLGIVLQRMGRMEEAVKSLEALQRDFPKESKLVADAKARLEEWVGQDLRGSFEEWFKRYQYSPAFQAKVVDLVLKLGSQEYKIANGAEAELLTIGAPAIDALKAHAKSSKGNLPRRATEILWRLGEVPPAEALITTSAYWVRTTDRREKVIRHGTVRADLRRILKASDAAEHRMLLAMLDGKIAFLRAYVAQDPDKRPSMSQLLWWAMDTDIPEELLIELKRSAWNAKHHISRRVSIMAGLRADRGQVAAEDVYRWIESPEKDIYEIGFRRAMDENVESPDAWLRLVDMISSADEDDSRIEYLVDRLLRLVQRVPDSVSLEPAVRVLSRRIGHGRIRNGLSRVQTGHGSANTKWQGRAVELFEDVMAQATGQGVEALLKTYTRIGVPEDRVLEHLLEWSLKGQHMEVRARALSEAARRLRGDISPLLDILKDPRRDPELRDALFLGLARNDQMMSLKWTHQAIRVLARVLTSADPRRTGGSSFTLATGGVSRRYSSPFPHYASMVFAQLLSEPKTRDKVILYFVEDPVGFPSRIFDLLHEDFARSNGVPVGVSLLNTLWDGWTPAQQASALAVCTQKPLRLDGQDGISDFAHTVLSRDDAGTSMKPALRRQLVHWLAQKRRTPALIKQAYDLDSARDVASAVADLSTSLAWAAGQRREVYDAFGKVFDPEVASTALKTFDGMFRPYLAEGRALSDRVDAHLKGLLARGDAAGAELAMYYLGARNTVKDMPHWLALLKRDNDMIRVSVASRLGTLYNDDAITALAKLVDDPNPRVVSAAIKSLERIKETEKKKDYWREYAKGKRDK